MVRVTVYIPSYNYANYLQQAINSVLVQTLKDYEIILIDDASTDDTNKLLSKYEHVNNIRVIRFQQNQGLIKCCNKALAESKGDYIIRLDADDFIDENALLFMTKYLDVHPDVCAVTSDYFLVAENGNVLSYGSEINFSQQRITEAAPRGAGLFVRTSCLKAIGGYDESAKNQDGYSLWSKFKKFNHVLKKINAPLYHYRRHERNVTNNMEIIASSRRKIKESLLKDSQTKPTVLGIIPVRKQASFSANLPFERLGEKTLLDYTLEEAKKSRLLDKICLVTEDYEVAEYAAKKGVDTIIRPSELASFGVSIEPTISYCLDKLGEKEFHPEICVLMHITAPFKTHYNIDESIRTLIIENADTVVGVRENKRYKYALTDDEIVPMFNDRKIISQRNISYEENGALFTFQTCCLKNGALFGKKISYVLMNEIESLDIHSKYELLIAKMLGGKQNENSTT